MDKRKSCRKYMCTLILFNLGILIYYIAGNKITQRTISQFTIIQDVALWGMVVLFDTHSLIRAHFAKKGYEEQELDYLQKKWYMKVINAGLYFLLALEIVAIVLTI